MFPATEGSLGGRLLPQPLSGAAGQGPQQPESSSAPGDPARLRDPQWWFPNQSEAGRFSLLSFFFVL